MKTSLPIQNGEERKISELLPDKTKDDWVAFLGERPKHFPSRSSLPQERIGFRSAAQAAELNTGKREISAATHALLAFLCKLQSLPSCLSIKHKGHMLQCQCNKQIPVPLSPQDSQIDIVMHTVFAYEFSAKDLYDQNVAFVKMLRAKCHESNGRKFFGIPTLGGLSYCKDTFCRMLGVSSRQYSKCLKASQEVGPCFLLDRILRGPEKGKPRCMRKARKRSMEQNRVLLRFFEKVAMEADQSTVRGLYKQYLMELGWSCALDKRGNYTILGSSKDASPFCSWTKFRTCWATYSSA